MRAGDVEDVAPSTPSEGGGILLSAMVIVPQGRRRVGLPIGQWQTYAQPR